MTRSQFLVFNVLGSVLAIACANDSNDGDSQASTTSTTSTTSGPQSGSVTNAPGSAADGTTGDSAPTMATASTTEPGTSATTGDSCGFLGCEDVGPAACDNFAQDCPEGQKCSAYSDDGSSTWNSLKCVDVTGMDKPGDMCTTSTEGPPSGIDSCIKGAMCWNVDAEGVGHFLALCAGSAEAPTCEGASVCPVTGDGVLNLCMPTCDPLLQDCFFDTELCIPYSSYSDYFICVMDGGGDEGQANDPCEYKNVCDPGLVCLDPATAGAGCDPAASGCCTPFCKFPDGGCPNPDQQCVQWFDPMNLPENDPQLDIGFCGVPG